MKVFNLIFEAVTILFLILFIGINVSFFNLNSDSAREYRVQAERICNEIGKSGTSSIDLSDYPLITNIIEYDNSDSFFLGENSDYLIRKINGQFYRIEYKSNVSEPDKKTIAIFDIGLCIVFLTVIGSFIFIKIKILKPFKELSEVPTELSKGNLTVPIKQQKNRYFGKFVWGLDLLREKIEEDKKTELKLMKDKKMLIMSISHDIKTPLSVIKLYSKALSQNLYEDKEKQIEIAESINAKAVEIENFVSDIIEASNNEFLHFDVKNGEFYLKDLVSDIKKYYDEKLRILKIDFNVSSFRNCVLKGDFDRSIEVIQNIVENAVKYGDGHYINIGFSEEEDCRLISVKNSGCTLSENEMPHIFESFWRGENSGKIEGSGLGLYICRQLMRMMDGEIFSEISGNEFTVTAVFRMV